jgi:hypothetical protein
MSSHLLQLVSRPHLRWPRGNDGLTRAERRAAAARYEAGAAAKPTQAEMDELRARLASRGRNE